MMLRSTDGYARFRVRDRSSGETWEERPLEYITRWQNRKMVADPDMLLQFAHFLADEYRGRGHPDVEVRVETRVSLNGRARVALIDPEVDLARERRTVWPYSFVMPMEGR